MVDLPHRFVPTSSRFVSPVRIVPQCGHEHSITAVSFSPLSRYFASADSDGHVKIWVLETLDILGSYLIDFVCTDLVWDDLNALICKGNNAERRIDLPEDETPASLQPAIDPSHVIRLIGSPEASFSSDSFSVLYNDNTFTHDLPGLIDGQMDVCERYVVAISPQTLLVVSAFEDDELMHIDCCGFPDVHWMKFHISERGDFVMAIASDGSLYKLDPIKQTQSCLLKGSTRATACNFGDDDFIIIGSESGNLTIYDVRNERILLRTPRCPRPFIAVYPSPEKLGFVALRPESVTAFFGYSQEILSASPLPGACIASCPGSVFSEVFVACDDRAIYRLKLDENIITKICTTPKDETVDCIGAAGNLILIHYASGRLALHNTAKFVDIDFNSTQTPSCISVSETSKLAALLIGDQITLIDLSGKSPSRQFTSKGAAQIILGKEKTANAIIVFKRDLTIHALDLETGTTTELNTIDAPNARILSVAPAAKAFAFLLAEIEHNQIAVYKVGLNSGKSSLALRIYTQGMQIWAASTSEQTVNFRNDATCLRIISGLKAYSVEDWARSEPLAIF